MSRSRIRRPMSRSQIMACIRSKDTGPELALRRALRERGIGYRLHAPDLPGRPDVVFRRARIAVFVHGCFWHRHRDCVHASVPRTRTSFWERKFAENMARDRRNADNLRALGWTPAFLWECEARNAVDLSLAIDAIQSMLPPRRP